jgi:methylase of polypeptide subunit release factors
MARRSRSWRNSVQNRVEVGGTARNDGEGDCRAGQASCLRPRCASTSLRQVFERSDPSPAGTQPFHPLPVELLVRPPTLIPRPETEHWVSLLFQRLLTSSAFSPSSNSKRPFRILDIGTGTGCIALGLTYALSTSSSIPIHTLAVDRAPSALELATENARRCGLFHPSSSSSSASHVSLLEAELFSPSFASTVLSHLSTPASSTPGFDLVVSNPPYIPLHEYAQLDRSVREWEDRGALVGELPRALSVPKRDEKLASSEDDGLVFYRRITSLLDDFLVLPPSPDESFGTPVVAFEVGKGQARAVERLLVEQGFEAEVIEDHAGVERAVFGRRMQA